jgi:hypothetical protein
MVLDQFVALVRDGEDDFYAKRSLFRAFGRQQVRQGRSLEALLAAYRIGARLAWRRTRDAVRRAGLDTLTMSLLAEATFAYIDELSAVSAEGFAEEQAARAGELERRRAGLVRLLTAPSVPDQAAVRDAASAAHWSLPATAATLVWDSSIEESLGRRLPHGALIAVLDGIGCALLPDPSGPGRRAEIEAAVGECSAVLGPTVTPAECGQSLRRATEVFGLVQRDILPREGMILAEEHLGEVLVNGSPEVVAELSRRVLAPLAGLSEKARLRLAATLLAWLVTRVTYRRHPWHFTSTPRRCATGLPNCAISSAARWTTHTPASNCRSPSVARPGKGERWHRAPGRESDRDPPPRLGSTRADSRGAPEPRGARRALFRGVEPPLRAAPSLRRLSSLEGMLAGALSHPGRKAMT